MLDYLDLEKVLFLDIETVPEYPDYNDLPNKTRELWDHKAKFINRDDQDSRDFYQRAGIYAEFGKIVCISVGIIRKQEGRKMVRLKSYASEDERELLQGFIDLLNRAYPSPQHRLCGHNSKEFDFPYIARRILINGLKLPALLDIAGKKPWEVGLLDTMELWKFGDYKSFTSLNLLTQIFDIPTPKDDIDGSDVGAVFWEDKDLKRISTYCQKDVLAVIQLMLRYRGEPLIPEEDITFIED